MREPKLIEHPGVPGKLREQTLDEFLSPLDPNHLAKLQLADIRGMAVQGMRAINELAEAQDTIKALREKLDKVLEATDPAKNPAEELPQALTHSPCPYCGKQVSTRHGPWAAHMKQKHFDKAFTYPTA